MIQSGPALGRLDPRSVLRAVRRASNALSTSNHPDGALRELLAALVPTLADLAALYVAGNDGGLRVRTSAGSLDDGVPPPGGEPPDPIPRDSDHPAAVACRERALAAVGADGGGPSVWRLGGGRFPDGTEVSAVGLPLTREGEPVGALYLALDHGRRYAASDLDLLVDAAERVSLVLDNVRLRREVRSARRAKSDFLSVMSHELRTPLTAVVGYADLLEAGISGPVSERQKVQLARIKDSAWELLELIDGILGYARFEGEQPELQLRSVEPESLVREAVSLVEPAAGEKGLEVAVACDGPLPSFPTDPDKARRILFHLLSNAVKFTHEGSVRLRISADRQHVTFSVSDTGVGIAPANREAIFEPFWQGESPETRTAGGAGMGLALALKLAELLSGEIDVESEVGKGSTFVLRLPLEGPRPDFL